MIPDRLCLDRARRRVQSRVWFTTFFALAPVGVLIALAAIASLAWYSPGAAIMALALALGALFVPWAVYRRQVTAALAEELRIRQGLVCPACYYDLSELPGPVCPECGTRREQAPASHVAPPRRLPGALVVQPLDGAMIIGHGIDLVEVARIAASVERHGQRFLDRVFTAAEQAYAAGSKRRMEHLAARFAAKEAALKALGTGWRSGIAWTDFEVRSHPSGAPLLDISGRAAAIAAERGITSWRLSLTHTEAHALASVVAEGTGAAGGAGGAGNAGGAAAAGGAG